jgi:hypothetical protein
MFPLVEFPELVRHYAPFFKDVFSAAAFIEFERYISGLIVSDLRQDSGWDQPAVCSGEPQSEFAQPADDRKSLLVGGIEPGAAGDNGQLARYAHEAERGAGRRRYLAHALRPGL